MANAGFSSPTNYFGSITGLTPKSSQDGATSQLATAMNDVGDVAAHDIYAERIAPSTDYAVTDEVDLSDIELGDIVTSGGKSIMITQVVVNTQAGQMPTVTISGIEVESGATAQRTVACVGTLLPRSRAQDVAGAFGSSTSLTQCNTTFKLETALAEVKGDVKASDTYDARIEVAGTWTDPAGSLAPTAGTNFTITTAAASSSPDVDYRSVTATATKFLELSDTSAGTGD